MDRITSISEQYRARVALLHTAKQNEPNSQYRRFKKAGTTTRAENVF